MTPEGWEHCEVETCCEILDNKRIPLNEDERRGRQGSYPYWGANGVLDHIDDYIFDEPLILMAEDGGHFLEARTRPICQLADGKFWVNNHAHVLRVRSGAVREWVYYWFVNRDITPYINGGTRGKLNQAELRQLPIVLPPLPEQKKIAAILGSVDDAIQATQAVIDQTRNVKQGLLAQLLTRGIGHTRFKKTEIGEIPEGWEVVTVLDVVTEIGSGWSPQCEPQPAGLQEWGILKTTCTVWDGYDQNENKRLPSGLSPRPEMEVKANDVLVTRAGPIERVGVVAHVDSTRAKLMLSDKLIRLKAKAESCDSRFLAAYLSGDLAQHYFLGRKTGLAVSQTNISRKILETTPVVVPPREEQEEIVAALSDAKAAITRSKSELTVLLSLKRGLMQDLLTGRVRVKGVA